MSHIIIDIGHADGTGARSCYDPSIEEHATCVPVGKRLAEILRARGHEVDVIDFPEHSNSSDLNSTISKANSLGADLLISLHRDAATIQKPIYGPKEYEDPEGVDPDYEPNDNEIIYKDFDNNDARGAHVCYYSSSGKKLASCIADRLCAILPGRAEQVQLRQNLAILKRTKPVAVLCELGFITAAADRYIFDTRREDICLAIADGVGVYLSSR